MKIEIQLEQPPYEEKLEGIVWYEDGIPMYRVIFLIDGVPVEVKLPEEYHD